MKYEELKGKTIDELNKLLSEKKKELFNLRFQKATGELEKTHRFSNLKKEIARIMTYINENKKAA